VLPSPLALLAPTPVPPPTPVPEVSPESVVLDATCRTAEATEPNAICTVVSDATGIGWLGQALGTLIPALLQIGLIVALAWVANRLLRTVIRRFVRQLQTDGVSKISTLRGRGPLATTGPINMARASMRTETIGSVLRSIASVAIFGTAFAMALGVVGINLGPLVAGAGILGVALGFGSQSLVKDVISGIFILYEDQYGIGDIVEVGEPSAPIATGTIEGISLRTTRLRDIEGTVWYVPNGEIRRVGNKSQLWARSLIDVSVAYGTDTNHASAVIKRTADELWHDRDWAEQVLEEPEVWGIEAFGPSEIVIRLVVKVEPARQWAVNRELRSRLLVAFQHEGIEIPFPQQTVWMHQVPEDGRPAPAPGRGDARPRDVRDA